MLQLLRKEIKTHDENDKTLESSSGLDKKRSIGDRNSQCTLVLVNAGRPNCYATRPEDWGEISGAIGAAAFYALYSGSVHLFAYTVFGIPIFFLLKRERFAFFWEMPYGCLLGIFAGIVPPLITLATLWGVNLYGLHTILLATVLGLYGLVTALAAWRHRPARLVT